MVLLGQVSQETLERAASDPRFLALYRRACETLRRLSGRVLPLKQSSSMLVAYFSMEYGLDRLHADLFRRPGRALGRPSEGRRATRMLPLVGVGLLYQRGFLQQTLDPGRLAAGAHAGQRLPLPAGDAADAADGSDVTVTVRLAGIPVYLKVWRIDVGRVKLYLLDSNIAQNADPAHRDITSQLYAGDQHKRIRQEIALGIGGLRALEAAGPEAHGVPHERGAFGVPRAGAHPRADGARRVELRGSAGGDARQQHLHHAHLGAGGYRSVRARADVRVLPGLLPGDRGFASRTCWRWAGAIPHDPQEPFSMAIAAFKTSAYRNAVSRLHRQRLAADVAGSVAEAAGVGGSHHLHHQRRASAHLDQRRPGQLSTTRYLRPDWRGGTREIRRSGPQVAEIPDAELWEAHRRRKRRLIAFVRERAVGNAVARKAPASEIKRLQEVLESGGAHHRIRAALRHLQARHAAVPGHGAPVADSDQSRRGRCRS